MSCQFRTYPFRFLLFVKVNVTFCDLRFVLVPGAVRRTAEPNSESRFPTQTLDLQDRA